MKGFERRDLFVHGRVGTRVKRIRLFLSGYGLTPDSLSLILPTSEKKAEEKRRKANRNVSNVSWQPRRGVPLPEAICRENVRRPLPVVRDPCLCPLGTCCYPSAVTEAPRTYVVP